MALDFLHRPLTMHPNIYAASSRIPEELIVAYQDQTAILGYLILIYNVCISF